MAVVKFGMLGNCLRLVEVWTFVKHRVAEWRRMVLCRTSEGHLANYASINQSVAVVNLDKDAALVVMNNF